MVNVIFLLDFNGIKAPPQSLNKHLVVVGVRVSTGMPAMRFESVPLRIHTCATLSSRVGRF